ncbi:ComEC/Rec2 family competence protein [Yersinia enterocolitica]
MSISIRILKANHGDCILVTHHANDTVFHLLIDGGNGATFKYGPRGRFKGALCSMLDELKAKGQHIDLAILTHIDDDHIGGLLSAFKDPGYLNDMVKSIWFNSSRLITKHFKENEIPENDIYLSDDSPLTSVRQGKKFESLLDEIGCKRGPLISAGKVMNEGPFKLTILSPNEENLRKLLCIWPEEKSSPQTSGSTTDYILTFEEILSSDSYEPDKSIANGSSIAFLLQCKNKNLLFLGDAYDETVVDSLINLGYNEDNKLSTELVKISHHGSQYNTSPKLIKIIDVQSYIISTNGLKHGLPNKRTIARLLALSRGIVYFNYPSVIQRMLLPDEVNEYAGRLKVLDDEIRY